MVLSWVLIVRNVRGINDYQFSDDSLLIGGVSLVIASRFKKILDWFLLLSGELANKLKC